MGIIPKDSDILPPYDDRIFKAMLVAPEAKPTLLLVSSAIIKRPVIDVTVLNNELPVSNTNEKAESFDVNCLIDDNTQVDIEMQANHMEEEAGSNHGNLRARSIYNLCDLHSSQNSKSKEYDKLKRTYQVMFCGFTVFPDRTDYLNLFSMRHDIDNGLLYNSIQAMFIELTKLKNVLAKPIEDMTDIEKFSIFLWYAKNPDYREIVNRLLESKEGLAVAGEVLMNISKDERERAIFRSRRIALADLESNFATVENRGKAEGRAESMTTVARTALKMKMPLNDIVKLTGLTLDEIEVLRESE